MKNETSKTIKLVMIDGRPDYYVFGDINAQLYIVKDRDIQWDSPNHWWCDTTVEEAKKSILKGEACAAPLIICYGVEDCIMRCELYAKILRINNRCMVQPFLVMFSDIDMIAKSNDNEYYSKFVGLWWKRNGMKEWKKFEDALDAWFEKLAA